MVKDPCSEIGPNRDVGGADVQRGSRSDRATGHTVTRLVLIINNIKLRAALSGEIAGEIETERGVGINYSAVSIIDVDEQRTRCVG